MLIFITERPRRHTPLARELCREGIYTLFASYETALFVCDKKDTGAVILDCLPSTEKAEKIATELRARYEELPILAITDATALPDLPVDMLVRETEGDFPCAPILEFCASCGFCAGSLSSNTLLSSDTSLVYLGYPLASTPRMFSLARALTYRYPYAADTDDLMSFCYTGIGQQASVLPVLISTFNKTAQALTPYPPILHLGKGVYRLLH